MGNPERNITLLNYIIHALHEPTSLFESFYEFGPDEETLKAMEYFLELSFKGLNQFVDWAATPIFEPEKFEGLKFEELTENYRPIPDRVLEDLDQDHGPKDIQAKCKIMFSYLNVAYHG